MQDSDEAGKPNAGIGKEILVTPATCATPSPPAPEPDRFTGWNGRGNGQAGLPAPHGGPGYIVTFSSISVTRAAIGERSERVSVTCANSGCPLSRSTTATTPS